MSDETSTFVDAEFNDPRDRLIGRAIHGGWFDIPIFTQMDELLWTGGTPANRPSLTNSFDKVLCLYPWEPYPVRDTVEKVEVELYDSLDQTFEQVEGLADMVNRWLDNGSRVLVHCQAGLNRSSLVAALSLMKRNGASGADTIKMMREKRCDAVLCNDSFAEFLLSFDSVKASIGEL